ncbi:MAG: DUF3048 domain-containing protein [Patescibacteria group bacterium]
MNLRIRLSKFFKSRRRGIFLTAWFLFVFGAGVGSFFLADYLSIPIINPLGSSDGESDVVLADETIREITGPLRGVFYSEEEADSWQDQRPLAVMIDNHELARPHQFGLQKAVLIYEAVAEGGITRFLAVFHDQAVAKLGPVRSARVYYIGWSLEFPAYYAHVGGAGTPGPANIHSYIPAHGVLDLDQFRLGEATFASGGKVKLSNGVTLSNIKYTSTSKLWQAGEALYPGTNKLPDFSQWAFKADAPYADRPASQKISFKFWSYPSSYAGEWRYDPITNSYLRFQGGKKHLDQATKQQLSAQNVVLAYMTDVSAGDGTGHRLYTIIGQGNAEVYLDGTKILATWKRSSLSSRMKFYRRGTNNEISFNRGLTWIEIVPK